MSVRITRYNSADYLEPAAIHPGEILREEFLEPFNMEAADLATELGTPVADIEAVLNGNAPVTDELASKLSSAFDTSSQFWLNMQAAFDRS
ncbi:HigA family addiction module antitoxin [Paradevosia shaoguanensis]|uniref:HigA family addiction module antitoxin n=1 Tax=Paradevosia shaoguanensis TaxID=1335043 RepID=UPI00193387EC|nr:HigA family addiction module antitoxin [Paradevosia shaoguanensis]